MKFTSNPHAKRLGFRSGLEQLVAEQLKGLAISFEYEHKEKRITYEKPTTKHKYSPDFTFINSPIIIETKGYFKTADRKKHLLIKEQYPDIDLRFVFGNSNTRISKQSKTTYAMWCKKNGFQYADKVIPPDWLKEIKHGTKRN